jgi:G3E family GTPase
MIAAKPIPVSLLTGFLGSGKTTLLNRMLRSPAWRDTAVVVNELGQIPLDHELVESSSDNVRVLSSGCLCCALQGDLRETLADLFVRRVRGQVPRFARTVVETTGLADPAPIANALVADPLLREEYRFSAIVTTVDAMQAAAQIQRYVEAGRQVAMADRLILTKTDLASPGEAQAARRAVSELNPVALLTTSVRGEVDPALLFPDAARRTPVLPAGVFGGSGGYSGFVPRHSAVLTSSFVIEHAVHWSGVAAWTAFAAECFGDRLVRAKGVLTIADDGSSVAIHGIGRFFHPPERLAMEPIPGAPSRLVCITRDVDPAEVERSMKLLALPRGAERPFSLADI